MPGTVTGTIGGNAGVLFEYQGIATALHLDIGFRPSWAYFRAATSNHVEWQYCINEGYAQVGTINGWIPGAGGAGQINGTASNVASINGIQLGTDTTVNEGLVYRGYCWR